MSDFSKNYFELFGLPVGFVVDSQALAERYRDLQKVAHPDRFAASGQHSQRLSLQHATLINEAYATLRDPLSRARYLLAELGAETADNASLDDPGFLMEQMELRERLAGVRASADPQASLGELVDTVHAAIRSLVARLAVQFETPTAEQLAAAAQTVQKLQFMRKLQAEAEAIEDELDEAC
jgi:molecular chaperone HscB